MTILDRIAKDGKLPVIETSIGLSGSGMVNLAVALIVAGMFILIMIQLMKKL